MRKNTILILLFGFIFILLMSGLIIGSFDFTRSERLGKTNYYLMENMANVIEVCYKYPNGLFIGVEGGRITDVYWNDEYILATQCDTQSDSVRGYYIMKIFSSTVGKSIPCEKNGPLSKEEYEQEKHNLGISEKKMRHINLYDNKYIVWGYVKFVVLVTLFLVIIICVILFFKSKIQ